MSKTTFDMMAAWHEHPEFPYTNVYYSASSDGITFSDPSRVPLPSCWTNYQAADPTVAFAQDGRGWVAFCGENTPNTFVYDRFWVAQKNPGYDLNVASPSITPLHGPVDKDVLAAGPVYHGSGDICGLLALADTGDGHGRDAKAIPSPPQFDFCTTSASPTFNPVRPSASHDGAPNGALILRACFRT